MARTKGAKDRQPRKRRADKPTYDAEVFSWLAKGHEAFELVKWLIASYFKKELTLGDVRPMFREPGRPVEWGCRLGSVPGHLRQVQVEGQTNRVVLIDRDWWVKAGEQERKGRLHALLARAAKEKPIEVSESALRAHGAYTGALRDIAEVGAKQLELELHEAEEAMGVAEPRAVEERYVPAPGETGGFAPEDFDEDGALKPLAEREERRKAAVAVDGAVEAPDVRLLEDEEGTPVEEGVEEFAAAV
jgi:hypothetical protein